MYDMYQLLNGFKVAAQISFFLRFEDLNWSPRMKGTTEQCCRLLLDVFSEQAEQFLSKCLPIVCDGTNGTLNPLYDKVFGSRSSSAQDQDNDAARNTCQEACRPYLHTLQLRRIVC